MCVGGSISGAGRGAIIPNMTAYSRKTAAGVVWRYDFKLAGVRYTSPHALGSKREAQAAEKKRRRAIAQGDGAETSEGLQPAKGKARRAPTLADAIARYWGDVGQHLRSRSDVERRLAIVARLLGPDTPVAALTSAAVSAAIQARRAEPGRNGAPLSAGGVNRDTIDTLRPVLNHAAEILGAAPPKAIAWKRLRLKEAGEVVREFTDDEISAWARELGSDTERLFLGLALTYGPRLGELFFPPAALREGAEGPELELGRYLGRGGVMRSSRKDGSLHTITLLDEDARELAPLVASAKLAGLPVVWSEEKGGELRAITYYAMRARLVAAAGRAGIAPGRIIHGMRHHAGTQIMRRTGSLVLAQTLLGHKQITTTRRYAHASKADLRAGLASIPRKNLTRIPPARSGPAR